ncbi:non-ribosomal peptide synthetase [Desulfobacter sp.]|uniref:non-ribosomal peptide synthetase n=1 Tax=Desulfobacter sp. TaxID=2294 RepID=UPI000E83371B|nr:non-ribosomal peptide synthetase [Desulfobacter sp.]HBT88792.1 non-ribosomal peptide synthetase [Desulfobacter sp.]
MDVNKTSLAPNADLKTPEKNNHAQAYQEQSSRPYELSPLQEGMLIHSLAEQGVGMYVSQGVHSFKHINAQAMELAWQKVVDRHEVLRSSFVWETLDKPLQKVSPEVKVEFEHMDLSDLNEWEQKIELRAVLEKDRAKGFDLTTPPLFRLYLLKRWEESYFLIFSHHHLLLDGWSNPILLDEVREYYQGIIRGIDVSLPHPKPFRLYIRWLRQQKLDEEKQFWQDYLRGFKRTTPLPYDLGAPRQDGYLLKSKELHMELASPLFSDLKAYARSCHVTLNTLIQAAWCIILSRYSGHDQIVFGSLVSGRSSVLDGIEHMIGMFLNTLPMHVKVDEKAFLKDWLKYVHHQQAVLHEHEFSPLARVQAWSELERDVPLFESVIDTNNTHQAKQGSDSDETILAPINQSVPILLFTKPGTDKLVIILIYNDRRFIKPCIAQVGEQLITLLTNMCKDRADKLEDLSMVSEAEAQKKLISWNQTQIPYPQNKTLHQLFEQRAAKTPDAIAVHYLDKTLTYDQFNKKANKLAWHLKDMGIGKGDLVGFCLDRSLDMVVVLMAVLKSGAGYVPLDPNYPFDRLEMMLKSSGAKLLIIEDKYLSELGGIASKQLCIDKASHLWVDQAEENLDLDLSCEEIAYVLYSSGSTGVPKGIVIPHKVPVNRMFIEYDPFEPDETLCAKTSICFVDSVWELWSAWANGLPVTLIPENHIKDPASLVDTLAASNSTRIVLVPSLLRSMMDTHPDLAQRLPRLKHWICSGEALPGDLSKRFVKMMPDAQLTNLYGATEIWDVTRCDTRDNLPYDPMPIGKIMGNMQGYVLDDMMRPVPIGVIGELHFAGVHVAHGYWKRPGLTARQFVPNPFSTTPGQRLYKTGDLGRWLPDGNFEYLGRRDQQIQLRGFRIELGDIESVIRLHPLIKQAAVVVSSDQRLVAYVVAKDQNLPGAAELRKHVRLKLPEHMTPAFYLPLEDIPLTPNGKTDRKRLPKPKTSEMKALIEKESVSREPNTKTEKTIAAIWANYLGLDTVGAESDFFQLGGESLMAVRIITQVGKLMHMIIPLSVLMKTRTVAEMSAWVDNALENGSARPHETLGAISKVDHGKKAPLSHAQQQMWMLDQLNPGSLSYTVPNIMQFRIQVDPGVMEKTLTLIIERHEILRTTFSAIDADPFQVIHEPEPLSLVFDDLSVIPEAVRQKAVEKRIRTQLRQLWDLENGPLFRHRLIKLTESHFILVMSLHHIVTDGRSMGILSNEIKVLYNALINDRTSPLKPLEIQYADYAIWQKDWLKGDTLAPQIQYWQSKLEDTQVLELPLDHPRPRVHQYRGGQVSITLDSGIVTGLRKLAQEEGATMFMALLAGFQLLLMRYTGQDDICVGTPSAGRSHPQLESLIGYFINTLVIRTKITGNPSFRELVQQVRTNCMEAYDNQDLPFEKLVDLVGVQRDLSINPLFQVLFVHQKLDQTDPGEVAKRQAAPEQETSNFDLVLNVQESFDKVVCKFIYNSDLFDPQSIETMGGRLSLLMGQCVDQPDYTVSRTSLLSVQERRQILNSYATYKEFALESRCAHEVIAQNALKYPDKPAVIFEGNAITYMAMERRANQVAHYLRTLGAGPENVVGWCVNKSHDIVFGLLGIMKSGAAFLPMDPAQPKERMSYMIKDAGVKFIVTQKSLAQTIPADLCQLVFLDHDMENLDNYDPLTPPTVLINPRNLAYVIYTSGSTGMPKGVMVAHSNLANLISAQIPEFRVSARSRVLQTLSLSFDAALGEIFRALMAGASLYLARHDDLMPGPELVSLLKEKQITSVAFAAAALAAMPKASKELIELENLTVGGDTISPELVAHWSQNRRFMNGYGPTETTIGATLAANWNPENKPPLGNPLPNVRVYILDRWMQPVPVGISGELYIGGVGVTRGYLNKPQQTALSFVPDPFSSIPGARLYRTGDMARWLPDGVIDFLGRMDHQVKIRGFRIELSEIEAILNRHPKVEQAIVVVYETNGVKRLAGYVTLADKDDMDSAKLRLFLKASLPDYMLPAFLMILDAFPLTVNGKIDRNGLPAPVTDNLDTLKEYVSPGNDLEKLISGIWGEVLGLEKVGIRTNYFELGGDSIMSIRVVARLTEAGYQMSLKDMFTHQTVEELAQALASGTKVIPADQGLVEGPVPLTPVQHWFFDQDSGNVNHFNQWMALPLTFSLDRENMAKAVLEIANHHDALRMVYKRTGNGQWEQFNTPIVPQDCFMEVDMTAVPDLECRAVVDKAFGEIQRSLDLEQGILFKVCWFNPGPHRPGRLLVVVHHIVMDIVSWAPFIEDLMSVYRKLNTSQPVKLPMKTSSFKQWSEALIKYKESSELDGELDYWHKMAAAPCDDLPIDFTGGNHGQDTTRSIIMEMDPDHTRQLSDAVVPGFDTQLSHFILGAFALSLHQFFGNTRVLINVEGQGREDIGVELNLSRSLGWFTSFYPINFDFDPSKTLENQIENSLALIDTIPNRGIGYSVLKYLGRHEKLHFLKGADISFNFVGQATADMGAGGGSLDDDQEFWGDLFQTGRIKLSESDKGSRRHLLEIGAGIMNDRLIVRFAYGSKLFKEETIQGLSQNLKQILSEMVKAHGI